jgi:hypothetical protein
MTEHRLSNLRDEASALFLGHGGVVGVGQPQAAAQLTVFIEADDLAGKTAVRDWAASKGVDVAFVLSGRFGHTAGS